MIQFIVGVILGFYLATLGVSGVVAKVNAGIDFAQEAAQNAAEK